MRNIINVCAHTFTKILEMMSAIMLFPLYLFAIFLYPNPADKDEKEILLKIFNDEYNQHDS